MTPWLLKTPPLKAQAEALRLADEQRGFAFFLEMGLGKTRLAYAEWLGLRRQAIERQMPGRPLEMVVVAPNSMKGAWKDEILGQGFGGKVRVWERDHFNDHGAKDDAAGVVYVFNYESIIYGGGETINRLVLSRPIYLALDESVHVKNFNASLTKNLIGYSKEAAFRRILSGNPRPESVMDLWSQLRCIGELDGVNPYAFRGRYAVMGGFMRKQVVGQKNEEELQERMRSFSFVALKKDWSDLPEKLYLPPRRVKMTPAQDKLYMSMWHDFLVTVNDQVASAEQMINVLNKCQQISSGFLKDDDGVDHELIAPEKNPKFSELLDALQEVRGKVIIPCYYRWSCHAVHRVLERTGRQPALMVGRMSSEAIDAEKLRFNTDDRCQAFVVQTRTGKYGHTLLGTEQEPCHTTIFFENDYSLDARIQVEDRNHRHGQRNVVSYQDLSASPAEDKVIKRLQEKREVSEDFLRSLAQNGVQNERVRNEA